MFRPSVRPLRSALIRAPPPEHAIFTHWTACVTDLRTAGTGVCVPLGWSGGPTGFFPPSAGVSYTEQTAPIVDVPGCPVVVVFTATLATITLSQSYLPLQ